MEFQRVIRVPTRRRGKVTPSQIGAMRRESSETSGLSAPEAQKK